MVRSETPKPSLETLDTDIVKLLESPESLRDQLLARQEQLLTRVKAELSAGRGIENALRMDRSPPPANAPPDYSRSSRQLTSDERAAILATAMTELEAQSATIRRDFHALHASVALAFPLRDCLLHGPPNGNKSRVRSRE